MSMKYDTQRGFTLVEAMVAVAILMLAVAGPLYTANRSAVASMTARDQLTASYLAQEGVEYVRDVRDNAFLAAFRAGGGAISATAWTNFLTNPSFQPCTDAGNPGICTLGAFQGGSLSLAACPGGVCTSSFSVITGGTQYIRTVKAQALAPNDEFITSTVSWTYHGFPYSVQVVDHLAPWQ